MSVSTPKSAVSDRLRRLRRRALKRADALVVTHLPNIRYLADFTGSYGVLVVTRAESVFFTAGLYRTQARQEVAGATVRIVREDALAAAGRWLVRHRARQVAYEADRLTVAALRHLEAVLGAKARLEGVVGQVEALRAVKSAGEIASIRASQKLTARVFHEVLPFVRPGVRELDLAAEIEFRMKRHGAQGPSFDTIVASGARSALPHGRPSSKRLGRNELVIFDLGAILAGYCSDMTRTVFVGTPSARIRRLYRAVQDALERAREAVQAGVEARRVDAAARSVLTRRGLGRAFAHGTGHGLGLEVHEEPRVSAAESARLAAGAVITLEPGIYLPGEGGIRIEDVVAVRRRGSETLTPVTTELICL